MIRNFFSYVHHIGGPHLDLACGDPGSSHTER